MGRAGRGADHQQRPGRLGELVIYDLPDDWFATYRDRIADVSADDVRRVAFEAVRPDRLAITIVGDADQVRAPLEALGLGPIQTHERIP